MSNITHAMLCCKMVSLTQPILFWMLMHGMRGKAFVSSLDFMALNKFTIKFQDKERNLLATNNSSGVQLREMLLSKKQGKF